ncbi:diguanylate cyclase [Thiohalorhabdus methylotrophus]|uniref:Diguanylate cyclase n=1 Tax=Thiohalorhabdus methylotrophus TaxID=3242694 RepID=A0ABV4TUJ2_9GAMM
MPDIVLFHLDPQTLFFLLAVLGGLIAVVFGGLWLQGVGRPATGPWALGHGVAALGYLLSLGRGAIPDLLSTVLGNTLALAGGVLILKALYLRVGRPFSNGGALAGVAAIAVLFLVYTYALPSLPARIMLLSVCAGALLTACAAAQLNLTGERRTWAHLFLGASFLFAAFGQLIRAALTLESPPTAGPFGEPMAYGLSKTMLLTAVATWTLSFLWLITLDLRRTLEREVESRRESERLFRSVFENTANAIALGDAEGRVILANEAFARLLGRSPTELQGMHYEEFTHPEDLGDSQAVVQRELAAGHRFARLEKRYLDASGRPVWVDLTLSQLKEPVGPGIRHIAVATDIRARKAAEAELEYRATYDALTGAVNRLHFETLLEQEVGRVDRYGSEAALVMFDLDHFKAVNDTHGHGTGDAALREVAALVRGRLRDADALARWGGEEFLVLLPETGGDAAARVGEELRRAVAGTRFAEGVAITISLGVTDIRPGDTRKDLLKRADDALYAAKHAGRNRLERIVGHHVPSPDTE